MILSSPVGGDVSLRAEVFIVVAGAKNDVDAAEISLSLRTIFRGLT